MSVLILLFTWIVYIWWAQNISAKFTNTYFNNDSNFLPQKHHSNHHQYRLMMPYLYSTGSLYNYDSRWGRCVNGKILWRENKLKSAVPLLYVTVPTKFIHVFKLWNLSSLFEPQWKIHDMNTSITVVWNYDFSLRDRSDLINLHCSLTTTWDYFFAPHQFHLMKQIGSWSFCASF